MHLSLVSASIDHDTTCVTSSLILATAAACENEVPESAIRAGLYITSSGAGSGPGVHGLSHNRRLPGC